MLVLTFLLAPTMLAVQKKWTDIGTTAAGNHVFIDPKSVKRACQFRAAAFREASARAPS